MGYYYVSDNASVLSNNSGINGHGGHRTYTEYYAEHHAKLRLPPKPVIVNNDPPKPEPYDVSELSEDGVRSSKQPASIFTPNRPSNNDIDRLRGILGPNYEVRLQRMDELLLETYHLVKQIRVLVKPPLHGQLIAIHERTTQLDLRKAQLSRILSEIQRPIEKNMDNDVIEFAVPYVARLRSLFVPVAQLHRWAEVNVRQLFSLSNIKDLEDNIDRIITVLRQSGFPGLEASDMSKLGLLDCCSADAAQCHVLELDVELTTEAKLADRKRRYDAKKLYRRRSREQLLAEMDDELDRYMEPVRKGAQQPTTIANKSKHVKRDDSFNMFDGDRTRRQIRRRASNESFSAANFTSSFRDSLNQKHNLEK